MRRHVQLDCLVIGDIVALASWVLRSVLANLANRLVRYLGRSALAARAAALLRRQCNLLIGYHFAASPHLETNGEGWLLDRVASHTHRFIDIGANRGEWSAAMLERTPSATGIAVDAGRAAVEQLRSQGLEQLTVVHAAVSDTVGEATFFEQPDAGEWSSLSAAHGAENAAAATVPQITVDALLAEYGWDHVDMLKIDVEGWDLQCLRGAQQALAEHRVEVVQFEYNAPWVDASSTLKAAVDLLEGHGYWVGVLTGDGATRYDYEPFGEFFRYSNFVALSVSGRDWLT